MSIFTEYAALNQAIINGGRNTQFQQHADNVLLPR